MVRSAFMLIVARVPTPVAQARSSRSMMVMDCRLLALRIHWCGFRAGRYTHLANRETRISGEF
jgi:hypothetical protein